MRAAMLLLLLLGVAAPPCCSAPAPDWGSAAHACHAAPRHPPPAGGHRCPAGATCCTPTAYASDGVGCCPFPDAVCCAGGSSCCPRGTRCTFSNPYVHRGALTVTTCVAAGRANVTGLSPCKPGPALPLRRAPGRNVVVIGDSVSIGWTPPLARLLRDEALVQHSPGGGDGGAEDTATGLQCLDYFLRSPNGTALAPDVLLFNWGLHDGVYLGPFPDPGGGYHWAPGNITVPGQEGPEWLYKAQLTEITRRLVAWAAANGRTALLFALTTPMVCNVTSDQAVARLNVQAAQVMGELGVPTVDLRTPILEKCGAAPQPTCFGVEQGFCPHCLGGNQTDGGGYAWLAKTTIAPAVRALLKHDDLSGPRQTALAAALLAARILPGAAGRRGKKAAKRNLVESGEAAFAEGRVEEAMGLWEDATRHDPANPTPHMHLGMTYRDQQQIDRARAAFEAAAEADPGMIAPHYHLATCTNLPFEALGHLRRAAALDTALQEAPVHRALAAALYVTGHLDEAAQLLTDLLELPRPAEAPGWPSPLDFEDLLRLADCHRKTLHRHADFVDVLERVVEEGPGHYKAVAATRLAMHAYSVGNGSVARDHAALALSALAPSAQTAELHVARALSADLQPSEGEGKEREEAMTDAEESVSALRAEPGLPETALLSASLLAASLRPFAREVMRTAPVAAAEADGGWGGHRPKRLAAGDVSRDATC